MEKEYRKLSTLKNWDKNPRSIKEKDFDRLKKQIYNLGQYKPLLITDDGTVLGGNMRLRAYNELGIEDVWVSVVDAPTEEKKLEYALSDNDRAGFYDSDLLANLIPNYPDFEWDNYAVDLGEPETLDKLIDSFKEVVEDEVPEVSSEEPVSKYGEVYQLGRHRLMCGDATKIEDVEKLMNGQKADISFTSPPYNVGENNFATKIKPEDTKYEAYNDNNPEYLSLLSTSLTNMINVSTWAFVNLSQLAGNKKILLEWLYAYRDNFADVMIWNKQHGQPAMQENVLNSAFEFIYIFKNEKNPTRMIGFKNFRGNLENVYTSNRQQNNEYATIHAATFPVHLPSHFISNFTNEGQMILDLFGGTGSTLIACEQTNRTCYMMELDPKYCDVIRKRYAKFVGKENDWQDITPLANK